MPDPWVALDVRAQPWPDDARMRLCRVDAKPELEEKCKPKCAKFKAEYDACVDRVRSGKVHHEVRLHSIFLVVRTAHVNFAQGANCTGQCAFAW